MAESESEDRLRVLLIIIIAAVAAAVITWAWRGLANEFRLIVRTNSATTPIKSGATWIFIPTTRLRITAAAPTEEEAALLIAAAAVDEVADSTVTIETLKCEPPAAEVLIRCEVALIRREETFAEDPTFRPAAAVVVVAEVTPVEVLWAVAALPAVRWGPGGRRAETQNR